MWSHCQRKPLAGVCPRFYDRLGGVEGIPRIPPVAGVQISENSGRIPLAARIRGGVFNLVLSAVIIIRDSPVFRIDKDLWRPAAR